MPSPERDPSLPPGSPDVPRIRSRALLRVLARLPQGALSRAFGRVADVPLPKALRRPVLGAFARAVGADPAEAELPIDAYPSLNRFFTRRLRPGARTWPGDPSVAACPVDGAAGQMGEIRQGRLIQAKGRDYSLAELLDDGDEWRRFDGGTFLTVYLSPKDYHRIHSPCEGAIPRARHVPGTLLPVNVPAVAHVPGLFARNERLLCYIDGPLGRVALVAVGAYNVGRISAAFDPEWNAPPGRSEWVTNRGGAGAATKTYEPPVAVAQGDEVMTFHLGSTIVLVFERGRVALDPGLKPGGKVRLGQAVGRG
jgi:phosphatidylserine decarboxylase